MEPTDWDLKIEQANHETTWQIEVEARLARIETKQDALYAEIHAVRLDFAKLVEGVMGAMQSNPLLSRLLGGGRKNAV